MQLWHCSTKRQLGTTQKDKNSVQKLQWHDDMTFGQITGTIHSVKSTENCSACSTAPGLISATDNSRSVVFGEACFSTYFSAEYTERN